MARPYAQKPEADDEVLPRGVYRRKRQDGTWTWGARWHDANGVEHKKSASPNTKQAALKLYRRMKHQADEGQLPPSERRVPTVAEVLDAYLPELELERQSLKGKRDLKCRAKYWRATLGVYPITSIDRALLANWRRLFVEPRELTVRTSSGTVREVRARSLQTADRYLDALRAFLTRCVDDKLLPEHPLAKLKKVKGVVQRRRRSLTEAEETQLQGASEEWLWEMVFFALQTGLRREEQFELLWANVRFDLHVLTIPRSKHGEARHLPIYPVEDLLRKWQAEARNEYVFPAPIRLGPKEGNPSRKRSGAPDRKVGKGFRDPDGLYRRHYAPAVKRAGLVDVDWHTLRHTFITRQLADGTPVHVVKELAGHKRIETTMLYAHVSPDDKHAAMQRQAERNRNKNRNIASVDRV